MPKEVPLLSPLVPALLDTSIEPHKLQELRNLPHLQKVAGLVFLLLSAKDAFYEEGMSELDLKAQEKERWLIGEGLFQPSEETPRPTWTDPAQHSKEWIKEWLALSKKCREELPDLLAEKMKELGLPFGFDEGLTHAIFRLANDIYENQRMCEDSEGLSREGLSPVDFLDETIEFMYFTRNSFSAWGNKIFPPEAVAQLRMYTEK